MKVSVEDKTDVIKIVHIEIPKARVQKELDKTFKQLGRTAKVKGFRPGKAPRSVLERQYGKDVRSDVASSLIRESFGDAVKEKDLNIVSPPEIDPPKLDSETDYVFSAEVEVRPDIADIEFKDLTLKKNMYQVSEKDIETQLKAIQKRMTTREPVTEDRPVADGDVAVVDYQVTENGQPTDAVSAGENAAVKIGEAQIDAALDQGIVGMTTGETRDINVTFKENDTIKDRAGKTLGFSVTLSGIQREIVPEIGDELAKKIGDDETLESIQTKIRENLKEGYDKRAEQEINEQVFSALIEKTDFELPDALVKAELDGIVQEAVKSFEYSKVSMEDAGITEEGMRDNYRKTAEKQVRRQLILRKIIDQEKIAADDDDFEAAYEDMAKQYQLPVEQIKTLHGQEPRRKEILEQVLLEKKALKLIIDENRIEEVAPVREETGDGRTGGDNHSDEHISTDAKEE